ncbi:hypothetical protein O2W15_23320 [Modestobacter sp. VKM Ac-2979]|uniref:hypothetical protein n=1 Tax=unclassified Modestobacter TaxID=2643866 RepID=UPI0022AB845F|nr:MULTISPECIES: hypothetical protein [unclassified Modestobacter]MCZ2814372.1 hypothetical protein [Modestobacter sp. VKM Ac-2979]MCZ2843936.1 hypothetical protein [Modestobacter sp. VKM Ac-2980]
MNPEVARLDVTGDLSIGVDGAPVRVTAAGGDVHVVADDVRGFVLGLRSAAATARTGTRPGRADLAELAGALADAGLTARLDSPSQRIVTVGAGVDSSLGRALLGTRQARPDAVGIVRASVRARAVETALGATLLALGYAVVRRRR